MVNVTDLVRTSRVVHNIGDGAKIGELMYDFVRVEARMKDCLQNNGQTGSKSQDTYFRVISLRRVPIRSDGGIKLEH